MAILSTLDTGNLPKSPLDAVHIVRLPVLLGDLFLAHRHTCPVHAHDGHAVNVILVEFNLQCAVMTCGPLLQPPALDDPLELVQLLVLAHDIAPKQLKLAVLVCALEHLGWGARKGSQSLGVSEGLVELLGGGAELLAVGHGGGVDLLGACVGLRRGGCGGLGGGLGLAGNVFRRREAAGRVGAGCVLDVLAVLGDQGGRQLAKFLAQLGNELGANEVLYRLLLF